MVIDVVQRPVLSASPLFDRAAMKKLSFAIVITSALYGAASGVWARAEGPRGFNNEARAQQQMLREQKQAQRDLRALQNQPAPNPPMLTPQRPPAMQPQAPAPNIPVGGPRRLTPEERQQLRDQIRDARRIYQQGQ
jgi:hypothetical protein